MSLCAETKEGEDVNSTASGEKSGFFTAEEIWDLNLRQSLSILVTKIISNPYTYVCRINHFLITYTNPLRNYI